MAPAPHPQLTPSGLGIPSAKTSASNIEPRSQSSGLAYGGPWSTPDPEMTGRVVAGLARLVV